MNLSVTVTHTFNVPPIIEKFLTAMLAQMGELPRTNSPGAAGTTAPTRIEAPKPEPQPVEAPAAPSNVTQFPQPVDALATQATAVPVTAPRRSGRPTKAEQAARAAAKAAEAAAAPANVAQQIPTVQPSAPVQQPAFAAQPAQPAADPFARAAQPAAPVANADPFARATQPAPFNPPAASPTAPAIPAASQTGAPTADDLKRAFERCLVSDNGEAKVAAVMGRAGVTYVNQLQPAAYGAVITDLLATASS